MKTGLWLLMVVVAGASGYLLGGREEVAAEGAARQGGRATASGAMVSSKSAGRMEGRVRSGAGGGVQDGMDAVAMVRELLGLKQLAYSDDPFADDRSEVDEARLFAAVMQAPEGAFPELLELCRDEEVEASSDDPFAEWEGGWNSGLLAVMLARWTEFHPQAAVDWLEGSGRGFSEGRLLEMQMVVAEQSVARDPEWALGYLERLFAANNTPEALEKLRREGPGGPFGDPFAESGYTSVGAGGVFARICREHPERALDLFRQASGALQAEGSYGWTQGMVEAGLFGEAMAFAREVEGGPGEELRDSLLSDLAEHEPLRLRSWLEENRDLESAYLEDNVMQAMAETDRRGAIEWYLGRARDAEDRAERVAEVADRQFENLQEARLWVEQMEREGVEAGPAWTRLASEQVSAGNVAEAFGLLERVPSGERPELVERLFKEGSQAVDLRFGGEGASLFEPKAETRAAAEAAGYGPYLEEFVREHNAEAAGKALDFLLERGLVEVE